MWNAGRSVGIVVVALAAVACAGGSHVQPVAPSMFAFRVDTFRTTAVSKGATAVFVYTPKGPWAIHVLDARLSGCVDVVAVKSVPGAIGRIKTSEMLRALSRGREVIAGVNADFFDLKNGVPANVLVIDGRVYTPPSNQPSFAIDSARKPRITTFMSLGDGLAVDDPALGHVSLAPFHPLQAVGGRPQLVRDSAIVREVDTEGQPGFATGRHPRTAVGIGDDGKRLFLVVVDGRQAGYSDGMTLRELANLMLSLGARDALNLDGGGSTTMVVANPKTNSLEIVNRPSDPAGERPVGDALAIIRCK